MTERAAAGKGAATQGDCGRTIPPSVLADIMAIFGIRTRVRTDTRACFPLRGCRATVRVVGEGTDPIRIDIVELGFSRIGFTTTVPLAQGMVLTVEFEHAAVSHQQWICTVVRAEPDSGDVYDRMHVGAKFMSGSAMHGSLN